MDTTVGLKEFYDVSLRLNTPLDIGNRHFEVNESILSFSTAQMAQVSESKHTVQARGGYGNSPLVNWETDTQSSFVLANGVLSPKSWAILSNSILTEPNIKSVNYLEECEALETEDYCFVDLKFCPNACLDKLGAQANPCHEPLPMGRRPELELKPLPPSKTKWIFVYDLDSGRKITDFQLRHNRLYFKESLRKVQVDYTFTYEDKLRVIEVGNRLTNGFLRLNAKMSVKDEKSGEVSTVLMEMPKVKISSNLSMSLGSEYTEPTVSNFGFIAYPDDTKGREHRPVFNLSFLNHELTGDYI